MFHEPIGSVPTVHVSFHLGEHYNSVRRADDSQALGRAPVEYFPIGHKLDAVKGMVGSVIEEESKGDLAPQKHASDDEAVILYALESLPCNSGGYDLLSAFSTMQKVFQELYPGKSVTKDMVDRDVEIIGKLYIGVELSAFDKLSISDKESVSE